MTRANCTLGVCVGDLDGKSERSSQHNLPCDSILHRKCIRVLETGIWSLYLATHEHDDNVSGLRMAPVALRVLPCVEQGVVQEWKCFFHHFFLLPLFFLLRTDQLPLSPTAFTFFFFYTVCLLWVIDSLIPPLFLKPGISKFVWGDSCHAWGKVLHGMSRFLSFFFPRWNTVVGLN